MKIVAGDRVTLLARPDDPHTELAAGDEGTVTFIDSLGTVHVAWDSGSRLGLIPEADQFVVTPTQEEEGSP